MSFYLSKILWLIINPYNILTFLFFLGLFSFYMNWKKIYKMSYSALLIIIFIIGILPTGNFLYYKLEKRYHSPTEIPKNIDGILILSGATNPVLTEEHKKISLGGSVERLFESILLIKKYPNAKVIFSGGSGLITNQKLTHAKVAKEFFENFGIDTNKIIFESKSRNTYENILFSKKLIKPKDNENWLLVTSAMHMTRSEGIAKKLDWHIIPYPVDYGMLKKFSWLPNFNILENLGSFQGSSHEWIGLIAYYLMGRTIAVYNI